MINYSLFSILSFQASLKYFWSSNVWSVTVCRNSKRIQSLFTPSLLPCLLPPCLLLPSLPSSLLSSSPPARRGNIEPRKVPTQGEGECQINKEGDEGERPHSSADWRVFVMFRSFMQMFVILLFFSSLFFSQFTALTRPIWAIKCK